jgi:16S rRNA (cytidine1402-2'-O)-methyltransferase
MDSRSEEKKGVLYVTATPIGNLEDITLRAIRILKEVDVIAAEDTRHARVLLQAYEIQTPLISLHEHNERERGMQIVAKILSGKNVAYISDAGTPCISDPGCRLIAEAVSHDIRVVPIPGPSALVAAVSVCGWPVDRFFFCGFLPPKEGTRRRFLESIKNLECPIVFYESPARILGALQTVYDILGNREMVVAREMTKVFEEVKRGKTLEFLGKSFELKPKGEFTVMVAGAVSEKGLVLDEEIEEKLIRIWENPSTTLRDAVSAVVSETGWPKKKVYDLAVKIYHAHR